MSFKQPQWETYAPHGKNWFSFNKTLRTLRNSLRNVKKFGRWILSLTMSWKDASQPVRWSILRIWCDVLTVLDSIKSIFWPGVYKPRSNKHSNNFKCENLSIWKLLASWLTSTKLRRREIDAGKRKLWVDRVRVFGFTPRKRGEGSSRPWQTKHSKGLCLTTKWETRYDDETRRVGVKVRKVFQHLWRREIIRHMWYLRVQGDHSGCVKPPVDIKTKVPFWYEANVLKRKLCFGVNGRFESTWMVTLYIAHRLWLTVMLRTLPCALSVGVTFAAVIPIDLTHSAQEEHRHSKMSVITENALVGISRSPTYFFPSL